MGRLSLRYAVVIVPLILIPWMSYRWFTTDYSTPLIPTFPTQWNVDSQSLLTLEFGEVSKDNDFSVIESGKTFSLDGAFALDPNRWSYNKLSEKFSLLRSESENKRLMAYRQDQSKLTEAALQFDIVCKSIHPSGYRSVTRFSPILKSNGSKIDFKFEQCTLIQPGEYLLVGRVVPWKARSPKIYRNTIPKSIDNWEPLDTGEFLFCRKLRVVQELR